MRPFTAAVALTLVGAFLVGCSATSTELVVKDPHKVALWLDPQEEPGTPASEALPASEDTATAPAYIFHNGIGRDEHVLAVRQPSGAIFLECRDCWSRSLTMVVLDVDGTAMRSYDDLRPSKGEGFGYAVLPMSAQLGRRSHVTGALMTPWSNVREVRVREGADPHVFGSMGAGGALTFGTLMLATGVTLIVGGLYAHAENRALIVGTGIVPVILGATLDACALWSLLGPSKTRVVWPPPETQTRDAR
jgi:hypothetical protein